MAGSRYGGVSAPAYVAMLVVALAALLLEGATEGRSWGLIAVAGAVAVADGYLELRRRPSTRGEGAMERQLGAVAAVIVGLAFVVLGALVAVGTIDMR